MRGKRKITHRVPQSFPWKAIVGLGVVAVVSVSAFNEYKYALYNFPDFFEYNNTLLHYAAINNKKDLAERLIAKGVDVSAKNKHGFTPLHEAVLQNSKDVAELLIAKGADINAKNNFDYTPLHDAAFNNSKEVAELLIAKGANVNDKN